MQPKHATQTCNPSKVCFGSIIYGVLTCTKTTLFVVFDNDVKLTTSVVDFALERTLSLMLHCGAKVSDIIDAPRDGRSVRLGRFGVC
jgi:hypothetical protein